MPSHFVRQIKLLAAMMACTQGSTSPVEFVLQPNDVAVREDEVANFSCKASRSPDSSTLDGQLLVVWKYNGSFLDTNQPHLSTFESQDGTTTLLRIDRTNRTRDSGTYQCSFVFAVGVMFASVDSRPAHLTFIEDRLEVRPRFQSVKSGRAAKLNCRLPRGMSSVEVTWEKGNRVLGDDHRIRMTEINGVHGLEIRKVQATDAGLYACVAGRHRSNEARIAMEGLTSLTVSPSGSTAVKKGQEVTFRCTATGLRPVEWFKGKKKVYFSSTVSVSQDGGQLTFTRVFRRHEGNYTCKVVGSSEWVTVSLRIAYIRKMRGGGSELVEPGNSVDLSCDPPPGYPKPTVKWYFKGREVAGDRPKYSLSDTSLAIQDVTEKDGGLYTCSASNLAGVKNITWNVTVDYKLTPSPTPEPEPESDQGPFWHSPYDVVVKLFGVVRWDCQIYSDPDFVTYSWVHGDQEYRYRDEDTGRIRAYPNGSLVISEIKRDDGGPWTCIADYNRVDVLDSNCTAVITVSESAVPLSFVPGGKPPSKFNTGVDQTISLSCSAWTSYPPLTITWFKDTVTQLGNISLQENSGSNQLSVLVIGKSQTGTYTCVVQDQRDKLSAKTEVIVMDPPVVRIVPESVNVYQGEEIRLTCEMTTGEGEVTLKWQAGKWPGLPKSAGNRFTEHDNGTLVISQAKTFDTSRYWCKASNPGGVGSASVNVTVCRIAVEVEHVETDKSVSVATIIAVFVVASVALIVVLGVWLYRKLASKTEENTSPTLKKYSEAPDVCNGGLSTAEIARSHLLRGSSSTVGSGRYWTVYKAELKKECLKGSDEMTSSVLVKELHEEGFNRDRVMKEVMALKKLCHDNVAGLVGVCTDQQPYLVVIENLNQGDLKRYLMDFRLSGSSLTFPKQSFILQQVISGLQYLASQGHVHKDIATRNCLVSREMMVKISDLSLCVDGYEEDYVSETPAVNGLYRPIRWMSPEAVMKDEFTKENDVWSFGIMVWEVVTMARQPYEGMTNAEVIAAIMKGYHQDKPDNCPSGLYEIMLSCWQKEPGERLSVESISGLLHDTL